MKFTRVLGLFLLAECASAHYIFNTLVTDSKTSTRAIRQPINNSPVKDYLSTDVTCNANPSPADETVTVAAGGKIGFRADQTLFHQGPLSIYLGKAPSDVEDWDGSGQNWFKIAEWGVETYNPLTFYALNKSEFTTTIPKNVPSGNYLVRIEQIGLHLTGSPEVFVSCGQIKVTGGGSGSPPMVSIPGYIKSGDPSTTFDLYNNPTSYTMPGPAVYRG